MSKRQRMSNGSARSTRDIYYGEEDDLPPSRNATIRRGVSAAAKPSIRLTVKAPPSKLRQALSSTDDAVDTYNGTESPEPPIRNARSTRNPRTVIEADSDEDMDDLEEDFEQDEEEQGEEPDEEEDEAEDDYDEDGDASMLDTHPPPPVIKTTKGTSTTKPAISVAAPPTSKPLKSVESKEASLDSLSELGSDQEDPTNLDEDDEEEEEEDDDEEEDDEEEEAEPEAEAEDDEAEETRLNDDKDDDDELSELDSDPEADKEGTPDLSKLTRRQQATFQEEVLEGGLLALSNEATKRKHLTAEEHAMRRAEMARRRKNLSEKRNEEEKMDTINKLLSKPAPKRRTRAEMLAAASAAAASAAAEDGVDDGSGEAGPLYVRWVNSSDGSRIGVPRQWLEATEVGGGLALGWKPEEAKGSGRLVEEVQ